MLAALPLLPAAAAIYPLIADNAGIPGGIAVLISALLASGLAFMLVRSGHAKSREAWKTDGLSEESGTAILRHGEQHAQLECEATCHALAERERQLAELAHEIRTPVSAVLGYTELMRESGLRPEQMDDANIIEGASRQVLALIDDKLGRTGASDRISPPKERIEQSGLEPRALLADTVAILDVQARKRGLLLEWTVDALVPDQLQGNPLHFRQVLLNLIGNAIRFTSQGSVEVTVALRSVTVESIHELEVRVSDTGIGIEQEAQAHIFEPFRQADDSISRRFGGTGLGLAIVRQLVHGWGGRMGVESAPGQGSTFWFTHPVVPLENAPCQAQDCRCCASKPAAQVASSPLPAVASGRLDGVRILVAEDNAFGRELLTHILGKAGARVTPTANAAAMLRHARTQDYELAILDLRLPDMRGDEAARRLRRMPLRRFPIMILSADVGSANLGPDTEPAVDLWLSKPVTADRLISAIRSLIPEQCGSTREPCSFPALPAHLSGQLRHSLLDLKERISAVMNEAGDPMSVTHELRGIAGYFGLKDIEMAAADLERIYRRNGSPEAISRGLFALIAHIEAAVPESLNRTTGDQPAALQ